MLTNTFLFVGYPYLMMVLAVLVSIIRYRYTPFSFSSLSSLAVSATSHRITSWRCCQRTNVVSSLKTMLSCG